MITTVSLNPSVDKRLTISSFHYGSMNRVMNSRGDAGGKAINVAVVAARLGIETRCVGFLRRDNGHLFENQLLKHGVQSQCIWLDGSVRTNLKVFDEEKGVVTEFNEPGEAVSARHLDEMADLIVRAADDSDYLVLTGSLPPGCDSSYYGQIIQALSGAGCRCVLDAEGDALRAGIAAAPYLIKPNRMEMEQEIGRTLNDIPDVARAALTYVERGIECVAVSLGERGALLAGADGVFYAPGLKVTVRSTVGAGDSMVAGMISGLLAGMPTEEVLRRGAACATASITEPGTRLTDRARFREMLGNIAVERVHV